MSMKRKPGLPKFKMKSKLLNININYFLQIRKQSKLGKLNQG
jgi:hypothetical protein